MKRLFLTLGLLLSGSVFGQSGDVPEAVRTAIAEQLQQGVPELAHERIERTPIEGIYKVTMEN
nr:hypothetical protein [Gammaproteobacteria bacterium]NIY33577.1 hypothetical protein [Gammaproteobacteria bacterium]